MCIRDREYEEVGKSDIPEPAQARLLEPEIKYAYFAKETQIAVFDQPREESPAESENTPPSELSLIHICPYTGLSTDLDIRHALATLPLWIAYVARMTGIHATIVAHTLLPLIFIPLTYYVFVQIGRKLFSDGSVKLPIFLTLVSIMQIWGNISIYTNETFFLTRTWQGKSVLANLILLVELLSLIHIFCLYLLYFAV